MDDTDHLARFFAQISMAYHPDSPEDAVEDVEKLPHHLLMASREYFGDRENNPVSLLKICKIGIAAHYLSIAMLKATKGVIEESGSEDQNDNEMLDFMRMVFTRC